MVIKKFFLCLAVLFATGISVFAQTKVFTQVIEWTGDEYASGYEIEIQDENQKTILTKTVENTRLEVSLHAGNYRYRIFAYDLFGQKQLDADWQTLKILRAVKPVIEEPKQNVIYVGKGQEISVDLNCLGIAQDTKVTVISADQSKTYQAYFQFASDHDDSKYTELPLKIKSMRVPEGKYFVRAENPGGLTFEGAYFDVEYVVKPVIIGFIPTETYCVKDAPFKFTLTGVNLTADCIYYLEAEDGSRNVCTVLSVNERNGENRIRLRCDFAKRGTYSIVVETPAGVKTALNGFIVEYTVTPRITGVKDGPVKVNSYKGMDLNFSAEGVSEQTKAVLVNYTTTRTGRRIEIPAYSKTAVQITSLGEGRYTAHFTGLYSGSYNLRLVNPGDFSDQKGEFAITVVPPVDFNVAAGIHFGTIMIIYNDSLPEFIRKTLNVGYHMEFTVIPFKFEKVNIGFEVAGDIGGWTINTNIGKNHVQSAVGSASILLQRPFLEEKLRIQLAVGGGYCSFGYTIFDGAGQVLDRKNTDSPIVKAGISVVGYPLHNLYMTAGFDYYHVFASNGTFGMFVPKAAVGARF
ncbi:MAG: hypothetical protein MJ169_01160 [Treponema sp.]|nr:hypothetical protein [Treponema sp.]